MAWHLETIRATVLAPNIKGLGLRKWEEIGEGSPLETLNPAPFTFIRSGFIKECALAIREEPERADLIAAARQLSERSDPTNSRGLGKVSSPIHGNR
jgi:hypothetical protein